MKKIFTLLLTSLTIGVFAQTPFTAGNLVVTRVGSGGAGLSNQSQLINIIEMTPTGTVVQTIQLPYTTAMATGGDNKICAQGSSSNDANLTISANGQYFVLAGYNSDTGIATISGVAGTKRVFCRIAMDGTWDTKTLMDTAKSKGNARCATSNDGTGFWLVGSNTGVRYMPYGSQGTSVGGDTAVLVSTTVTNNRTIQTFGGDLIVGTGSGAVRAGVLTGFPTTPGNTLVSYPGHSTTMTANNIYLTSLPGGPAGLNTMYISSDAAPSGIRKYCKNSGTGNWDSIGIINSTVTYRGMTATTAGSNVTIYAISGGSPLQSFVDATGYNVSPTATPTVVLAAPSNTAFRGVQLVPTSLPVRLLSFNAAKSDDGTARLWWVVNGDDDITSYIVEKGFNSKEFTVVSSITASGINNYEYNDNKILTATTYYRLKFVSKNGKSTYSNVVAVTPKKSVKLEIFPNPVQSNLIVSYAKTNVKGNISIASIDGKCLTSIEVKAGTTQTSVDLSNLNKGNYVLTFLDADGNKSSKTIIKN
jgi:hypothetical protein